MFKKSVFYCLSKLCLKYYEIHLFWRLVFLTTLCIAGVCGCRECSCDEDGRKQPGDGDGTELPPLRVGRSEPHLREHAEGDGLCADSHSQHGHQLHGRCYLSQSFGFSFADRGTWVLLHAVVGNFSLFRASFDFVFLSAFFFVRCSHIVISHSQALLFGIRKTLCQHSLLYLFVHSG